MSLGITLPIGLPAAPPSVPDQAVLAPSAPAVNPQPAADKTSQDDYNAQAAEQKRMDAVKQLSEVAENPYPVSDHVFSLYKDSSGQYITRYVSLRDGKITYVPESSLYQSSGASNGNVVKINV